MIEFRIDDMTCGHCASTITKAVQSLDQAAKRVRVDSQLDPDRFAATIVGAGFTPTGA